MEVPKCQISVNWRPLHFPPSFTSPHPGIMFDLTTFGQDTVSIGTNLTAVGLIVWWAIYFFSKIISSALFGSTYTALDKYNQYEWNSRVVSTIHAFAGVGFSFWVLLGEGKIENMPGEWAFRITPGIALVSACSLSYWLYDMILMFRYWDHHKDYPMLIHHIVGIIPFTAGILKNEFISYAPYIIMTEMSTPFVNMRWFLAITHQTTSLLYALNGLGMWFSFLTCRIIWIPYSLGHMFYPERMVWIISNFHVLISVPILIGLIIAYLLSCYWFFLITKGLVKTVIKMISGNSASQTSKSQKTQKVD